METEFDELLLQVLDQPASERRAFLEASGADPAMCADLLDLVAREDDLADFLKQPAALGVGKADAETATDRPRTAPSSPRPLPETIGPYTVLEMLGEGGMGVVYLAEQTEPVQRKLAVKVIKANLTGPEAAARFSAERQALARLSHPHIAQLYEAGTTDEGFPYFAMEYFAGVPVTDFCDQQRLLVEQRLELFTTICDAVQHAHQRGIIHRDLKPSNILVGEVDGRSIAKVIDFGIAKAVDQPLIESLELTGERLIGTPAYMSPESLHVTDGVLDVDTRTDVYSLGIVLYELLVGVRPFSSHGSALAQVVARIASEDAPKPSTRLSSETDETREIVAEKRGTEASTLRRSLAGDLDWIVGMAIAKDRDERYTSAAELAADVRRHLTHQPVLASPPSVPYRIGKFVRRYRALVAVSMLGVVALIAGTIGTTIGMVRAGQQADRANREASAASEVSSFLVGLFKVSDPSEARGNSITARELLDKGAERIHGELVDQPLVQAQMMQTIGNVYSALGLPQQAVAHLESGLAAYDEELPADDPKIANALNNFGRVLVSLGRYEEAEKAHRRALAIMENTTVKHNEVFLAESLRGVGIVAFELGRYEESEAYQERAMQSLKSSPVLNQERIADTLNNLGNIYVRQGSLEKAEDHYRRALELYEKTLPPDHPRITVALNNLGIAFHRLGRLDEAERVFQRSMAIREKILDPNSPLIAAGLNGLGNISLRKGEFEKAADYYRRALAIREHTLGPDHPDLYTSLAALGVTLLMRKSYAEAEPYYDRSLEILTNSISPDDPRMAVVHSGLGNVYHGQNRYQESETSYRLAIEILGKNRSPGDRQLASLSRDYARLLRDVGREEEAEAILELYRVPVESN